MKSPRRTAVPLLLLAGLTLGSALAIFGSSRAGSVAGPDRDAGPGILAVDTPSLSITLGFHENPGLVSLRRPEAPELLVEGVGSALVTPDGATYRFPGDFSPVRQERQQLIDPLLGPAQRVSAAYRSLDGRLEATLTVTVAQDAPALLYQISADPPPASVLYLSQDRGRLNLSHPVEYLTLLSNGPAMGALLPDSNPIVLPLPQGAPLRLWGQGQGLILGLPDEAQERAQVQLSMDAAGDLRAELSVGPLAGAPGRFPRLSISWTGEEHLTASFRGFRAILEGAAPAPPIIPEFRHQWGSWYVYYGGISEALIRSQIDAITSDYTDLGPWQVVVDAGWYYAGGHPDGEMGAVDRDKFPSGMRELVDYAHDLGIGVVLYASAPWVDSRPGLGNWWVVLRGFVRDHPEWLLPVREYEEGATYVYDFSNPDFQAWYDEVLRRMLVEFDADGVLLDMTGLLGGSPGNATDDPVAGGLDRRATYQTMEIYRQTWEAAQRHKPGAWVEGAWAAPPLARSYAHTWRYADEAPAFSYPYPHGGLLEHLTFAALQEQLLGRRSHLGFLYGGENALPIQLQWLGAAVALQRQVILSDDLNATFPETARRYREYLAALKPFAADPVYGPGTPPESLSTMLDGTLYLGLVNPGDELRPISVDLTVHGVPAGAKVVILDPESREAWLDDTLLTVEIPPQTFRLLVLRWEPGVLWSDRAWSQQDSGTTLVVEVGPAPVTFGRLWLFIPDGWNVALDGGAPVAMETVGGGVVAVEVPDGGPHVVAASP